MSVVSTALTFLTEGLGCIASLLVRDTSTPNTTSQSPPVCGSLVMSKSSSGPTKDTPSVHKGYWFKAYTTLHNGTPSVQEGGVDALTPQLAMIKAKEMVASWCVNKVSHINLYEMHGTTIGTQPVLFDYQMKSFDATPRPPKIDMVDVYNKAGWTTEFKSSTVFSTIKLHTEQ